MTKPVDFSMVEDLRKAMLLTISNMADVFGVSRETWYNWQRGIRPRNSASVRVRRRLRQLFHLIATGWPSVEVISASQAERFRMLQEELDRLDAQSATTEEQAPVELA